MLSLTGPALSLRSRMARLRALYSQTGTSAPSRVGGALQSEDEYQTLKMLNCTFLWNNLATAGIVTGGGQYR